MRHRKQQSEEEELQELRDTMIARLVELAEADPQAFRSIMDHLWDELAVAQVEMILEEAWRQGQ